MIEEINRKLIEQHTKNINSFIEETIKNKAVGAEDIDWKNITKELLDPLNISIVYNPHRDFKQVVEIKQNDIVLDRIILNFKLDLQ